jgi:hypothetical protein
VSSPSSCSTNPDELHGSDDDVAEVTTVMADDEDTSDPSMLCLDSSREFTEISKVLVTISVWEYSR